jgi:hypothetical protein
VRAFAPHQYGVYELPAAGLGRTPTFTAIIAHADDASLLRRCIAHHLGIGVDAIFVSLNVDDSESTAVLAEFAHANVHAARLETFASDEFDYFTAALRAAMTRFTADWVLFVDTDEYWIPASGSIRGTAGLGLTDLYSVARFNVPPVRARDGAVREPGALDPATTLLIRERHVMDTEFLERHPGIPFVAAKIGPKIMVRPELVETVAVGAHDFTPHTEDVRTTTPPDLLIVHLPFTTASRFHRKIEAVRRMLERHADRYTGSLAWHWRRWVALADAGRAGEEFAAQLFDEADLPELLARGTLATPNQMFAGDRVRCA